MIEKPSWFVFFNDELLKFQEQSISSIHLKEFYNCQKFLGILNRPVEEHNLGKIGERFIFKKMKPVMTLRSLPSLMRGWQLESLSGIGALNFREDIDVPILTTPNDVLVKVEASSVNPLDVMMTKGWFGRQLL